jgi:hypothetical protein
MQADLNIDSNHVIVDREDWLKYMEIKGSFESMEISRLLEKIQSLEEEKKLLKDLIIEQIIHAPSCSCVVCIPHEYNTPEGEKYREEIEKILF